MIRDALASQVKVFRTFSRPFAPRTSRIDGEVMAWRIVRFSPFGWAQRCVCGARLLAGRYSPTQTSGLKFSDDPWCCPTATSLCNAVISRCSSGWVERPISVRAPRPLALDSGYLSPEEFQWWCGPEYATGPQRDHCARTRLGHHPRSSVALA